MLIGGIPKKEGLVDTQHTSAVDYRSDGNDVLVNSIDDLIAESEPFRNIFVVKLGHDAAC